MVVPPILGVGLDLGEREGIAAAATEDMEVNVVGSLAPVVAVVVVVALKARRLAGEGTGTGAGSSVQASVHKGAGDPRRNVLGLKAPS